MSFCAATGPSAHGRAAVSLSCAPLGRAGRFDPCCTRVDLKARLTASTRANSTAGR